MIVNGVRLEADLTGAVFWPEYRVLAVADLHFEKGTSYAARAGLFLPPYDSRATLEALDAVVTRRRPELVLCLGDSFHDGEAGSRLADEDRARIRRLTESREWIWIAGNHDPDLPEGLGGRRVEEIAIGPLLFRHEPSSDASTGEIAGHLHPCATVTVRGKSMRRRCFASDGARAVLPAFGAYTGGLDVFDEAFAGLFPGGFDTWLIGRDRVRRVPTTRLRKAAATSSP
jgi:DNA ligase-associated metallophosphoesterase